MCICAYVWVFVRLCCVRMRGCVFVACAWAYAGMVHEREYTHDECRITDKFLPWQLIKMGRVCVRIGLVLCECMRLLSIRRRVYCACAYVYAIDMLTIASLAAIDGAC